MDSVLQSNTVHKGEQMKQFNIYFEDLNEQTQQEVLKFYRLESAEEGNLNLSPLCILEVEVEVEKEEV